MPELTIQQRFGTNATLSAGVLTIQLSDLTSVGLDASSPTSSQILAALVLLSKGNEPINAADDPTIGATIADPFKSFVVRSGTDQIQHQYSINLYETDNSTNLDPDNIIS